MQNFIEIVMKKHLRALLVEQGFFATSMNKCYLWNKVGTFSTFVLSAW